MALTPEEALGAMAFRITKQAGHFREALDQELCDPQNEGRKGIEVYLSGPVYPQAVSLIEKEFKEAGWSIKSEWSDEDLFVRFIVSDYWKTLSPVSDSKDATEFPVAIRPF